MRLSIAYLLPKCLSIIMREWSEFVSSELADAKSL